jgi:DNA-binding IclR family transcriptional regulator
MGTTELSNIMLQGKSSTHQQIKILENAGFIEQDDYSKNYNLTTKLLEMVNHSLRGYYERTHVHTYLKRIAEATGASTYFGLKNRNNRIVYVDSVQSKSDMVVYTNIGDSPLPHCTAHGKALLAFLTIDEIERIIDETCLESFTENTITEKDLLLDELRRIRQQKFAFDNEERAIGVRCIAAPVFDSRKEVIGAIGISAHKQNLPDDKIELYSQKIMETAESMSINVGNNIIF